MLQPAFVRVSIYGNTFVFGDVDEINSCKIVLDTNRIVYIQSTIPKWMLELNLWRVSALYLWPSGWKPDDLRVIYPVFSF
jgi:hypothetical protein